MTWLPNFLNPITALIAAGIVIPSLLILYFLKLRRREMPVSSTLLWKKAIQDLQVNAPFQKLRRNLLLLLQLLLLVLLLLALSRPVANYTPGAGEVTVIVIDRSASMNAKDIDDGKRTRLDEAKRRAKDLVASMSKNATAMVVAMDHTAETVQTLTSDQTALRRAIDDIRPSDRKSRLKMAYQLADAQTQYDPEQLRLGGDAVIPGVFVYSDGRVLDDPASISVRGNVTFERIGTDTAPNVAVVALSAKRNYERPTEVQVFARLANFGPEPVETGVLFTVDGAAVDAKSGGMLLLPERWSEDERMKYERETGRSHSDSVELPLDLTRAAIIRVEHTQSAQDVLAADDVATVVVPPPKMLSVLLVSDGNYFLEKAMASLNLRDPVTMNPVEYEEKAPTDFDVIIFDRYYPAKIPKTDRPWSEAVGSFLYFGPSVPAGLKIKAVTDEVGRPTLLDDIGVLDWKRDHPILKHLAMGKLYVAEAVKMDVPLDSEVLLDGLKCPLIALHREGKATHLVVAFDLLQSNWPLKVSFPIFLHNALQFMAVGAEMDVRQSFEPGSIPRIPRPALQKVSEDLKTIELKSPDGSTRTVTIPPTGDFALPALDHVGVYETDPKIPPYERFAVNLLDPVESNTLPAANVPGGAAEVRDGTATRSRIELWWWIVACAALPLLMIEWWVYTRRVHL